VSSKTVTDARNSNMVTQTGSTYNSESMTDVIEIRTENLSF